MSPTFTTRGLLLTAVSVAALGGSAFAQQTASVEEVVVTAQRRAEALQNVPISMTVKTGEQLEQAGIQRLEDISNIAPAVQISRTGVYTQPSIRGITSTLGGNYENNVAIYVDGSYLPFTRGLNTDVVNIAQIQVLKGPQGTLFGRNATGGAILVQTADPSMTDRSGHIAASYERYNNRQFQGYFSTPITSKLAWNIAASYRKSDDYIKDDAGFNTAPIEQYNISTKLRFEPTDNLSITAKYETLEVSDGRPITVTYEGKSLVKALSAINPAIPANTLLETGDNLTSLNRATVDKTYQHNASAKVEYDFGPAKLMSLTTYQQERDNLQYDLDGTPFPYFEQHTLDRNRAVQEDLNLTSTGKGPIQYVAGFFFIDIKTATPDSSSRTYPSTVFINSQASYGSTKSYAGYGDVTWEVAPKLFLTGGLRYSHEAKHYAAYGPTGALLSAVLPETARFNSWTPRGVIRYELDDNSNVYASYSKGYKSGLINAAAPFNIVQPEKVDAYEVGYKTARGMWRLDTAAYYYDYKNLQVSSTQIINGINTPFTTNAATAHIYGAEAQLTAKVAEDFNVSSGIAYTHARYASFPNAVFSGIYGVNTPAPLPALAGLNTATCNGVPCTQSWTGKQLPRSPDWSGNIGADYTIHTAAGKFVFAGNIAYQTSFIPVKGDLDASGGYRYGSPGYVMINLRTEWSPPNFESLTLTAYGQNVSNSRYYFYRSGNAFGDYHVLGQPATWGIRADYRF